MINVQVKATSLKHLKFGMKLGRDKSLSYIAAGRMPCSAELTPAEFANWIFHTRINHGKAQ